MIREKIKEKEKDKTKNQSNQIMVNIEGLMGYIYLGQPHDGIHKETSKEKKGEISVRQKGLKI